MCFNILLNLYLDFFVCSIDVQPEPEATPIVEDTVIEPRQQGKQTPIDHVDKNLFPSLSLMHDQDDHLVSILTTQLNPYPLHGLSSCHSSKQTTILADIGVVYDHVAPATVTAYMHVSGYNVVTVVEEL